MYGHKYTDDERQFFVEYVPGHSHKEIQQEFISRFGWEIKLSQVKGYIANHKLKTGRTGYIPKGNIPHNKGKKMPPEIYAKCKGTMFKKGNVPQNHRPVGSERINRDGYVEIKIAEPNKWTLKHRLIWQQAHGEIPKGQIVIFRDNDRTNVVLENLLLISQNENLIINRNDLSGTTDETKDAAVSLAKLISVTNQRKKKRKK